MKKPLIFVVFILLNFAQFAVSQTGESIKVMTWNIRLDVASDNENQWKFRKQGVCSYIKDEMPAVLGVQEAMSNQMADMRKALKGYKSIGVGRDDGKEAGEFSALFYKRKVVKPVRSGTFWLSETPDVPGSRGWDAACNRVVTWAEFVHKESGRHFMVFNTHFDHMGDTARVQSAMLINRKIAELANRLPVILTGDFNVNAKHRAYRILTFPENEYVLTDSRQRAVTTSGPEITWVSFEPQYKETDLIDFIFTTHDLKVIDNTIFDFRQSGRYLSDHLPVIATLRFN